MMRFLITLLIASAYMPAVNGQSKTRSSEKKPQAKPEPGSSANSEVQKVDQKSAEDGVVVGSSTRIDFSETAIDGKMKAPDGFFLQGKNSNSLSQMVKLRSHFRNELRNSRSAVKSHVK